MELQQCLKQAVTWAKAAGEVQRSRFQTKLAYEFKSSGIDLVTEVDKASEKIIVDAILEQYPDHGILAEEGGSRPGSSDYLWVIDPLDGTTNYAQGLPIFAISIALKKANETILGVVYAPLIDQLFTAIRGEGAFLNGKRLSVGVKKQLIDSVIATGFPYDGATHKDNNGAHFVHMLPKARGLRRMGAAAYDLAMVACGALDGYWEFNLSPWDVAAGELLVREAGGVIIPLHHKRGVSLIAGNPTIAELIRKELTLVDTHGDFSSGSCPLT